MKVRKSPKISLVHLGRSLAFEHYRAASILLQSRYAHQDYRSRLSTFWTPSGGIASGSSGEDGSHSLLLRAGFLRQAHSGIFHLLPLGLKVQEKLEKLIEKHMKRLGASKLALSSISSENLWRKSGRLSGGSELFRFQDRKHGQYLLSPTHEEEITALVSGVAKSYKEFPLRLYQISRKYRDEPRPRHGLLRTREFVMKDLYTFDYASSMALETYEAVREAYRAIFDTLKVPYLIAEADSGNMGGNLSHEYHVPTLRGEDHIVSCDTCGYVANEDLAQRRLDTSENAAQSKWRFENSSSPTTDDMEMSLEVSRQEASHQDDDPFHIEVAVWSAVTHDKMSLVNVYYPTASPLSHLRKNPSSRRNEVNVHAVKALVPDLDAGTENAIQIWEASFQPLDPISTGSEAKHSKIINIFDYHLPSAFFSPTFSNHSDFPLSLDQVAYFSKQIPTISISRNPRNDAPLDVLRIKDGDSCARCSTGTLKVQKAVELGHTFHLGTRYSELLGLSVTAPINGKGTSITSSNTKNSEATAPSSSDKVIIHMGCHGIGVSRMIGAVADLLRDEKGLNWPRVMAPFDAVIVPGKGFENDAVDVYDAIVSEHTEPGRPVDPDTSNDIDAILDDRPRDFAWKLKDADLVGYPVIVILGRAWKQGQTCEVQCRRLGLRTEVAVAELPEYVRSLLAQL